MGAALKRKNKKKKKKKKKERKKEKETPVGVPTVAKLVKNPTSMHEDACSVPVLSLRICLCCKLQYRLQMWVRFHIAVAVV